MMCSRDANNISNSSLQHEARNVIVNVPKLDVISAVLCNFTNYIANDAKQHIVLRQDCNDMIVHNGNDMYVFLTPR